MVCFSWLVPRVQGSLSSLNPAVKMEAARVILRLTKLAGGGSSNGADGAAAAAAMGVGPAWDRMRLLGAVPSATAAAAIEVWYSMLHVLFLLAVSAVSIHPHLIDGSVLVIHKAYPPRWRA